MLAKQGEGAQGEDEDDVSLVYLYCMYYLYNYGLLYGQVCRNISQGKPKQVVSLNLYYPSSKR